MAHRTTLEEERPAKPPKAAKKSATGAPARLSGNEERERIFDAFRRWGYLEATLDPLGLFEPLKHPDLDALAGETAEEAPGIYCNTIGAHFMHLPEPERRPWIPEPLQAPPSQLDQTQKLHP